MNVTNKILTDDDYRKKYFDKLKSLDMEKNNFIKLTQQMQELEKKKKKAEGKKKKSSGTMVSGATNKSDIRRLQRVLHQKIAEVAAEEDDSGLKNIKINDLQSKIETLNRILAQIEKLEREQIIHKQRKNKKGATEAIYLSSDDLTVNKDGTGQNGSDAAIPGIAPEMPAMGGGVDLLAGFEAAIGAQVEAQNVDVQV